MYLGLLAVAGVTSAVLAANAWRNRRYPGFSYFAAMELAMAWWILCYLGEQLDPERSLVWFALKFPAIGVIPPSWLLFTLCQTGRRPRSRAWALAYLWPAVLLPLAFTNDGHRLLFSDIVQRAELVGLNGPLFPVHLFICYAFFVAAARLLLLDWQRRGNTQSGLLLIGGLIPFGGNVLNEVTKLSPEVARWIPLNPTLPGFAFSALFIGWAAMRYRLLDPRPVARDTLFESMPEVVLVLNERDVVVDANRAAREMLGLRERDLLGRSWTTVFAGEDWHSIPHGSANVVERPWTRAGAALWVEVQRHVLWDSADRAIGQLIVVRDVTARKQFEQELRAQSYRDRLTGLSNRRYLDDEAARLQASREYPVTVFAFDLDGLKLVNDRQGHAAGDVLLQGMAAFLTAFFRRAGDRVIRQGGDEFLVLLPETGAEEAERVRSRLATALAQFNAERSMQLRFSTGVSVIADGTDWAAGVKRADERLYEAKREAIAG